MSHQIRSELASEPRKAAKKTRSQVRFSNGAGGHPLEFRVQRASQKHLKTKRHSYCKSKALNLSITALWCQPACTDFSSPPEKLIAGILGILWFALLIALVISTRIVSPPQPCAHCPKEWISYLHNCYYVGVERKSWSDSLVSCISKKCSLLHIESEEEQDFLGSFSLISWTAVIRGSRSQPWIWKNGSTFKPKITEFSHGEHNCAMISASGLIAESCTTFHSYFCKCKFTN